MKKAIGIILFVVGLFATRLTPAQGTLYVSNLGQTPIGSAAIGSDSWIAQRIITGTDASGYILNSIQLLMDAASGSPGGFNVSIYSSLGGEPHNNLGSLIGSDPSAGGIFTYNASGITLLPSADSSPTFYFVVVTTATPVAQGAYDWSAANSFTEGSGGWCIDDGYFTSANGSSWTLIGRQDVFQLAINATAVPEPATLSLAGMSLACLSLWRHGQKEL
jgi:hypothetical protein